MGWTDICSWTTCLGARREEPEDVPPPRPISKLAYHEDKQEVLEKKFSAQEKVLQPPPPPPSVVSDRPYSHHVTERDLPPVPPVPPVPVTSIYEMGFSSPRNGVTRSNSRSSIKTSTSVKSRKRRTQNLEKHTISPPVGLRRSDRVQSVERQAVELASPSTSHRSSIRQPLVSSTSDDGKMSPLPVVSRSSPKWTKEDDELPIVCNDEEYEEEYDDDSLKELRRRSDSAPIPLRMGLRHSHTIRRKPVTPKASISFSRPTTVQSTVLEEYAEQMRTLEGPVEMDAPVTFELSADPKSRTQSYYADPGIVLLAATLDEVPPPMPEHPPSLVVDTGMQQYATADNQTSKKLPFSPLTTVNSPVDDMAVSPITPHGRNRLTWMKRSKSVGAASASRQSASSKRRSLSEEPPLPILPASVYSPPTLKRQSHADSLLKTESTNESSRRTSNSSNQSETSSHSSLPSRGPSPSNTSNPAVIKRTKRPEQELEMLRPVAFQRRSTNAPIPLISSNDNIPLVPSLPPQAYHFTTPIPQKRGSAGLVRSLSSKNIRTRDLSTTPKSSKFTRSKSIYYTATTWNNSSDIPSLPNHHPNREVSSFLQHPASIPLPDSDTETESDPDDESEYGSVKSGAAELESQDQGGQYIEETEPRSVLPTPIEREKDPLQETWGKGIGAEWGVAY
ncbi:MAG: hypothetical protein GOMPHAMPRED_005166 [Gomphillus americanus]|uniref:Uncharacterized protein n=1 Tax=Gomphillus americanus TaxID=1940652 RepID=A0A8H3FRC4_9LECA|nr:MAG: hypothetical protein GOMPHAMPRED_005166 [Gomphillus americanus]